MFLTVTVLVCCLVNTHYCLLSRLQIPSDVSQHKFSSTSTKIKDESLLPVPVLIELYGDPRFHPKVKVKLTTPSSVLNLDLTKVETILHHDAKVITILPDSKGQPDFQIDDIQSDVKRISNQFFHNADYGTVVSLRRHHDGQYHMEGHLDRVIVIAPPSSRTRHPRALDTQSHTLYTSWDTYYLDNNQPDIWNLKEHVKRYNHMLSLFGNDFGKLSNTTMHFGVPKSNRSGNRFLEDVTRKADDAKRDLVHESDDDSSEDYIEVPAEFEDKKNWEKDGDGRAQRRADDREDRGKRKDWRRKFRRNSNGKLKDRDLDQKYQFGENYFYPDDQMNVDFMSLMTSRSGSTRHRRQTLTEWAAFDLPSLFHWNSSNLYRSNHDYVVEVMVVVDARAYQEFQYDWSTLQVYLLHFWQSFSGFQPFIENNRIEPGSELVDVNGVLMDFMTYTGQHYESNPSLPDHDIAILLTGEDLCKKKSDGTWSQKTKGIAFIRGGCISSRRFLNQSYDLGVAEVGPGFRGVLTAAHEVGHLLGAFHDGEKNSSDCPSTSGYIMSSTWTDPYVYNRFSNCSKQNLKHFLERTWYSECLLSSDSNYTSGYNVPTQLPGQLYTLADQCQHFIEGTPCKNVALDSQCGQLCCEKWSQPFTSKEPAADGTVCGDRKMCYNGECLHQALIPFQ
ncbi:uncharacterized protein LOC106068164 isoform X2 [Biomphalaria glabrata]|uniref:Uncharacterized protein LOC106068164 isoform X2 n=1 Tax=Biomphalaria glabrata TaxID=6526 RepID=A0A9W3AHU7_BIOGL|nr:uncharacterized protein LOC106068164 isoform X2 [Biomphalaria glabrata]